MESKIVLKMSGMNTNEDIKSAVLQSLVVEFLIDNLKSKINAYSRDVDLTDVSNSFDNISENNQTAAFASLKEWTLNKMSVFKDLVMLGALMDSKLTQFKQMKSGSFIDALQEEVSDFTITLSSIDFDFNEGFINLNGLKLKKSYIDKTLEQMYIVDENQVLVSLSETQLTFTPLNTEKYRNKIVEDKISKLDKLCNKVSEALEKDFEKFMLKTDKIQESLRNIAYESLTDGEKVDKARKTMKQLNVHRRALDKLEDELADANELKRQLLKHSEKLNTSLDEEIKVLDEKIASNAEEAEMFVLDKDSISDVYERYLAQISEKENKLKATFERLNQIHAIYEKCEGQLKTALPTESDLKKYSTLGFKYQDLAVRLEVAKSQVKGDKEYIAEFDTATAGLEVLISAFSQAKDLFVRQSLMTASFNIVNTAFDLVEEDDEEIEASQVKFVTSKLSDYSTLCAEFANDLLLLRNVGNNGIRDLAIMMGKPFNKEGLFEIINVIDLLVNQTNQLCQMLDKNLQDEIQLLTDILSV